MRGRVVLKSVRVSVERVRNLPQLHLRFLIVHVVREMASMGALGRAVRRKSRQPCSALLAGKGPGTRNTAQHRWRKG